eukprot:2557923-Rhodomonas_salina.4
MSECRCVPGYYVGGGGLQCVQCEQGFYCKDGFARNSCTQMGKNMTTRSVGTIEKSECVCPDGQYYSTSAFKCWPCPSELLCVNKSVIACPLGQNVASGNSQCLCKAGTYQAFAYSTLCKTCPADRYCLYGSIGPGLPCPLGTVSVAGSANVTACVGKPKTFGLTQLIFKVSERVDAGSAKEEKLFSDVRQAVSSSTGVASSDVLVYWKEGAQTGRRLRQEEPQTLVAEVDMPIASSAALQTLTKRVAKDLVESGQKNLQVSAQYTSTDGSTEIGFDEEEVPIEDLLDSEVVSTFVWAAVVLWIAVGVAVILIVILVVWCCCCRGKDSKKAVATVTAANTAREGVKEKLLTDVVVPVAESTPTVSARYRAWHARTFPNSVF